MLENSPNLWQNMSLYLIDPTTITCCVNFGARNSPNLWQNMSLYLIDPIAITCCVNFGATKFTKSIAKYEPVFN